MRRYGTVAVTLGLRLPLVVRQDGRLDRLLVIALVSDSRAAYDVSHVMCHVVARLLLYDRLALFHAEDT